MDAPPSSRFQPTPAAAWLLLVVVAVAPFAYGVTRLGTQQALFFATVAITILWIGGLCWERRRPRVSSGLLACVGGLLAFGWLAVWLQPPPVLDAFSAEHLARLQTRWATSVTLRTPAQAMQMATATLLAVVLAADLLDRTYWKKRYAMTIVSAGAGVALLGLAQNALGAAGIYGEVWPRMPGAFFGPFFHHTAAGAFLNLTGVIALAALFYFRPGRGHADKAGGAGAFWIVAAALIAAGHTGHVSRAPQVLALVFLGVLLWWFRPWRSWRGRPVRLVVAATALVLFGGLAWQGQRLTTIADRWQGLFAGGSPAEATAPMPGPSEWPQQMRDDLFVPYDNSEYFMRDRGASWRLAWRCVQERPLLGYGPGAWTWAGSGRSGNPFLRTFYLYVQFTHQDYLQVAMEWGLVGLLGWGWLYGGAVLRVLRRQWRIAGGPEAGSAGNLYRLAAALGLTVLGVQAFWDFPWQIGAVQFYSGILAGLCWTRRGEGAGKNLDVRRAAEPS